MNCNFNCNQGRNCPTRQACELPEAERIKSGGFWFAVIGFCALLAALLVAHFAAPYL